MKIGPLPPASEIENSFGQIRHGSWVVHHYESAPHLLADGVLLGLRTPLAKNDSGWTFGPAEIV